MNFDLNSLCVGKFLGKGSRSVYEWLPDDSLVLKVDDNANGSFQNVIEWNTWTRVEYVTAINHWFAPCVHISTCGKYLLQKKTTPMSANDKPDKLPSFFTDLKTSNFGLLDGKVVAHDYGLHLLLEKGMSLRLVKADWWNE